MPVSRGSDSIGPYYRWGAHGKKYHYQTGNLVSRRIAQGKAAKQGRAAHAAGYR